MWIQAIHVTCDSAMPSNRHLYFPRNHIIIHTGSKYPADVHVYGMDVDAAGVFGTIDSADKSSIKVGTWALSKKGFSANEVGVTVVSTLAKLSSCIFNPTISILIPAFLA